MKSVSIQAARFACALLSASVATIALSMEPTLAPAQALLDDVHTVATAEVAVPVEHTFTIANAGSYRLTLVDLGAARTPSAPLASVKLAVLSGASIVGTPLAGPGTLQFNATPGTYRLHITGAPGPVNGSGPIGVQVTNGATSAEVAAFSDSLALPALPLPSSEATLDDSFTVLSAGSYQISLADLALPSPLAILTLFVAEEGGTPITVPPLSGASSVHVTLTPGVTYRIFAVAQTSSVALGGLFSATVTADADASTVYAATRPVGGVRLLGQAALVAGNHSLTLADLAFPAALADIDAVLVLKGQEVAHLSGAGAAQFTATGGTHEAFVFASPSASPGAGSYALQVSPQSGPAVLSVVRAVTTPGGSLSSYAFDANLAAAGNYTVRLSDFAFPAALASARLAAVQGVTILGAPITAPGSFNITAANGPLTLLAVTQASAAGGLLDVNIAPVGGGAAVFDATQGVGAAFSARKVDVTLAGNYQVSASDVGFPASFFTLAVVVTRDTDMLGSISSAGVVPFQATPGSYFINFLAQPGGADKAGTYSLSVAPPPPAPVVTLASDAGMVTSGGAVTLTWTSQNATSCTASGGWSGAQSLNGNTKTSAITTATTYTLNCSGTGGTTSKSVTVNVDSAAQTGSGGGGAFNYATLYLLAGVLLLRLAVLRARHRRYAR